jgi:hypothetical protein
MALQWLKLVFNPQTVERANQKPRVLICDNFGTHETLEILEFCFQNNIILCRPPSHISYKLQPYDISVFGPLKAAYRNQIERLKRGYIGTIDKKHFAYLYDPARNQAFMSRNIRAEWTKAGLFPFNPNKVLHNISKPFITLTIPATDEINTGSYIQDQVPQTPVTPKSAKAVASLHNLIQQNTTMLDGINKQRLQKHLQKLTNAAQLSFTKRALLQDYN